MKMTNKILSLLFRIFCVILFTVQVLNIMNEYGNQKPATIHSNERQEAYPRPLFCFSVNEFDNENFNTSANITFNEYTSGNWKTDDMTEEELFNFLTPKVSSLIKKIRIKKNTDPTGDSYESIDITIPEYNIEKVNKPEMDYSYDLPKMTRLQSGDSKDIARRYHGDNKEIAWRFQGESKEIARR